MFPRLARSWRARHSGAMEQAIAIEEIHCRAAAIGLVIDEACVEGVTSNLLVLQRLIALIEAFPLDPACEPAPEFRP